MTSGSKEVRVVLLLLVFMLVLPQVLPLYRYASALTCGAAWYSQGDVKLQLNECLRSRIVTPSTTINFTVTLTNLGPSSIKLVGVGFWYPFEVDVYNSTGVLLFVLRSYKTGAPYIHALGPGASVSQSFDWSMASPFPELGSSTATRLGQFYAQAFLDSITAMLNGTIVISSHVIAGPLLSYEVVAQLILSYDVFEMLMVALMGVNIVISWFVLREIRNVNKRMPPSGSGQADATKQSGEQKAG